MKKHYVESSGNIYADLGVDNPQEARAKADLAHRIVDIIASRKLTQVQAGKGLGGAQPKRSAFIRGRLTDFVLCRLFSFLLLPVPDRHHPGPRRPHANPKHTA